jgi:hypothetical protein
MRITVRQTHRLLKLASGQSPLMEWSGRAPALPATNAGRGHRRQGACHVAETRHFARVIGIDIGRNSFHIVGQNQRGAIVLRQKWSRGQLEARLANLPPCRIGMEACVGAHHLSRTLKALGHDARLMPAKYLRSRCSGGRRRGRGAVFAAACTMASQERGGGWFCFETVRAPPVWSSRPFPRRRHALGGRSDFDRAR